MKPLRVSGSFLREDEGLGVCVLVFVGETGGFCPSPIYQRGGFLSSQSWESISMPLKSYLSRVALFWMMWPGSLF